MVDWLVPISRRTRFLDRSGRTITARFETVRAAALSGRLVSVAVEVRGALADVQERDTIWLFWSDHDLGVMAVGRARPRPTRRSEPPALGVTLDRARTRTLVVDPMPASLVHRWVSDLRSGSRLDLRPRAFEAIRAWEHERAERDDGQLRPLGLASWRARAGQGSGDRPVDDAVLASVVPFLRSQDFAVGIARRDHATRLVARRNRDLLVVHGVAGAGSRPDRARAVGDVREHRWSVARTYPELRLWCGAGSPSAPNRRATRSPSWRTRACSSPGGPRAAAPR